MKKLPLWLHIIFALVAAFLIVLGFIFFLDTYTRHGKETEVPQVTKKNLKDAIKELESRGFKVVVDSTFRDSLPPLYVIKQFPESGENVKAGRTIQLIVNKAIAPLVEMPALLGVSVSSALQYLLRNNLKLGDTIYKPDFAVGRILQQMVNGKDVASGTMLSFGTKVTLVIGSGTGGQVYNYPDFYGMTLKQAYMILDTLGLSRGAIVVDRGTTDSLNALIYKQSPPQIDPFTKETTVINQGQVVEFWVSNIARPREVDTTAVFIDETTVDEMKQNELKNPPPEKEDETPKTPTNRRVRRQTVPKPAPTKPATLR